MVDFSKYVSPGTPIQHMDYGRGFRALMEQRGRDRALNENARQFDINEKNQTEQFNQNLGQRQAEEGNQNTRFSLTLEDTKEDRNRQYTEKHAQQMKETLKAARAAVVSGKYEQADALLGPLSEMGVKVNKTAGPDGSPIYNFRAPSFGDPPGPVNFDDINSKFSSGPKQPQGGPQTSNLSKEEQIKRATTPSQSQLFTGANPFESPATPGLRQSELSPEDQQISPDLDKAEAETLEGITPGSGNNSPQGPANIGETAPQGIAEKLGTAGPVADSSGFDPYSLDTKALKEQISKRLDPALSGIMGAFPQQYRGRAASLLGGYQQMGMPPDETLDQLQKPLDTVARLMNGEMSAQAAYARASNTGESQAANRNIRLEDRMWRRVDGIGKSFDLPNVKQRVENTNNLIGLIDQNNPSADALLISQLRNMIEKGVMTDNDFVHAKEGIKPVLQRIKDFSDEQIMGTGLNPDSRKGIKDFLNSRMIQDRQTIGKAQTQLMTQAQRAGSEEELKTVYDYVTGNIPQSEWSPEIKEAYGIPVEKKTGPVDKSGNYSASKSVEVKGSGPSGPTHEDIDSEVEDLLKEDF